MTHPFGSGPGMAEAVSGWVQEIAPYGIFLTDHQFVVRSWNQWLVTHSGISAERAVGKTLWELFPSVRERHLDERYERALAGEISMLSTALHQYLLPLPTPARELPAPLMLQSARVAPLQVDGVVVGTITVVEDVTQRECQAQVLLRQQEYDRLRSLAAEAMLRSERAADAMSELFPKIAGPLRLDVFFQYRYVPEAQHLKLLSAAGITAELRKTLAALPLAVDAASRCVPGPQDPSAAIFQAAQQIGLRCYIGFPLVVGGRLLGAISFGSYERVELGADDVEFLSQLSLYVAAALDRAEREEDLRDARARLSTYAEELETRVAERTAKLNETVEQLESFSYTVAHDLRTPIRALTGFSDILQLEYGASMEPAARELLARLHRAGLRLDALTRDLLVFSRLGTQHVALGIVEVDEVMTDIQSVTPLLKGGQLTVERPLGSVWAQRTLLQQCLANLLDNALKFSGPQAQPQITVRSEQLGRERRIWVEDKGIGIDAALHRKIFEVFERVPGEEPVEGTGIGLAIVARAVRRMGGSYGVESAPQAGSRFWLQFPAAE